jgi:M6 family metalloprotease-like protein
VPAAPESYIISQPTGQTFEANQNGDEFQNWVTKSDDQSVIIQDTDGFWKYAQISFGDLAASDAIVGIDPAPSDKLISSEWIDKVKNYKEASIVPKTYYADGSPAPSSTVPLKPAGSSQKVLVLLVSFTNQTIQNTEAVWSNKFFGGSGNTVNNYYKENSADGFSFTPASESYGTANDGVIKVTLNYAHPNTAGNTSDSNRQIVKDALTAADPYVDFSSFDTNGNGYIDMNELHIVTITAGYEASCGSTAPSVWGHRWSLGWTVPAPQLDGKYVAQSPYGGYTQQGEIHATMGNHIATIGILCHELGHDLGLFDEYNTSNSSDPSVGASSVMSSGSWGRAYGEYPGETPAHMDPWSKIYLGFVTPLEVTDGTYAVKAASIGQYNVLKIDTSNADQYFLVENRNLSGFDAGLYYDGITNGGVAIWHIDETVISSKMASNTVNNDSAHRGVELERAVPGSKILPYYISGGANDLFSNTTTPNSKLYSGTATDISIKTLDPTGTSMQVLIGNPPGIQFSPSTYTVAENASSISLTVNRTGGTTGTLTVDYTTADGTATAGSDYTATSGTLTFADGEASKTITIPILDDTVYEGNETFSVKLSNISAGSIIVPTATVTIIENEAVPAQISISPTGITFGGEGNGTSAYYDFKVTRSGNTSGILTVDYSTSDGTAIAGSDYQPLSGTLTFANGETVKTIRLNILWDGELEDTEMFTLGLSNASSGVIVNGKATVYINDLDISFDSLNYTVNEGSGNIILTVNRGLSNSGVAAKFSYTTANGTATAGADYTAASGIITFAAGELSKTITIPILDDAVYEGDETFTVNLTDVLLTQIKNPTATVTIHDNDTPTALIGFDPNSYTVNESDGSATLTVTRTTVTTGTLTVDYATSNGTASAGSDYSATSGTITFADGETSKTITVPVSEDAIYEGNESFKVTLSNQSDGNIIKPDATVTIVDNDAAPQITFDASDYSVAEDGGSVTVTVNRSGNTNGTVSVNYTTVNGTALAGSDYTLTSGTLTFADGETTKNITVNIIDDTIHEMTETFKVRLSNAVGGVITAPDTSITITDNDTLAPSGNIVKIKPYVTSGTLGTCSAGFTQQLIIYAVFENGGTLDITALATWTSQYPDVATVDAGLITGLKAGISKLSFTYNGKTYEFLYTINP